jgi:SET domain-containing protein
MSAKAGRVPAGRAKQPGAPAPEIDPKTTCFRLRLAYSPIHRWGIYAEESIPKGRKIMEYTGEKISRKETKRRYAEREENYLFTLNPYWTLDGAVGGSGAQYINHSCEPNCLAQIVKGHILYKSKRPIQPGEELTIDYRFDKDVDRVVCKCGTAGCRGTINLKE